MANKTKQYQPVAAYMMRDLLVSVLQVVLHQKVNITDALKFPPKPILSLSVPGLPEWLLLVTNCYLLPASLKFVTFATTLPTVVTFSLDY